MSAVAVKLPFEGRSTPSVAPLISATSHPVPSCVISDDSKRTFTRAAFISVTLHLGLVLIALTISNWPSSEVIGTPIQESMDVTIIPLSALDTVLPKGAPNPNESIAKEPESQHQPDKKNPQDAAVVQTKTAPLKKIVPAKTLSPKSSLNNNETDHQDSAKDALQSTASLGVANGEALSLEQARISYQDMVATMLARAKRYPERALKRRMTGEGSIRLEISADGSLADFRILRSTDAPILDEELKAMVDRAAPFPAFPNDLRKTRLALIVPIAFRLES